MPLDAVCDVAQTLLMDDARVQDSTARLFDGEATHVADLRAALDLPELFTETDIERGDADVIVLKEWKPADLMKHLAENGQG